MTGIYIGLGANLESAHGTPHQTCKAALARLAAEAGVTIVRISCWYRSAPVPASDQRWFVNAVAELETRLGAEALIALLHAVEGEFGRERLARNAARGLDLDLLDFRGQRRAVPGGLVLPHPRLAERLFVLLPLKDVASDWCHPESGRTIDQLLSTLDPGQRIEPFTDPEIT